MSALRMTVTGDGSSDKILTEIVAWIARDFEHLEFNRIGFIAFPGESIRDRIQLVNDIEPCDILILHRDAENETYDFRKKQILSSLENQRDDISYVCLIPVKMSEAWFLHSPEAMRAASGNPNGEVALDLPTIKEIERCDAKNTLMNALRIATELSGRRLNKFNDQEARHNVARLIEDFSILRKLPSFKQFEDDLRASIQAWIQKTGEI